MGHLALTLLVLFAPFSLCSDQDLKALVTEVLEDTFDKYGMIRRCARPTVDHGYVTCTDKPRRRLDDVAEIDDLVPGSLCSVACEPGYTAQGGVQKKDGRKWVTCGQKQRKDFRGHTWSEELRCEKEIPLLVVTGGSNSAAVEVISFHNSSGCDLNIPDIRKTKQGEVRLMHNMFYHPSSPFQLWVCNGLTTSSKASCHSWQYGSSSWTDHSDPNESWYQSGEKQGTYKWHRFRSGRYGAASFTSSGQHYIAGGMLNEGNDHKPTDDIRKFIGAKSEYMSNKKWPHQWDDKTAMKTKRALFCIAQLNHTGFAAIGGHSGRQLEKSVEMMMSGESLADMGVARSGHGCVGVEGGKILVSGGSDKTHRSGGQALATAEMYSSNAWEQVGDMNDVRFGHALVNVAGRIIAVGGKRWNPDVPLKSAEEFDVETKRWRSLGDVLAVPRDNFGYALIPHTAIPGCKMW